MIIKPAQIRAARALLDWTVIDLGKKVGVGPSTISAIETGRSAGSLEVLQRIYFTLHAAGLEFTESGGVQPIPNRIKIFEGHEGFCAFFDDIYAVASSEENPQICVTSVDEALYDYWLGSYEPIHVKRMNELKTSRIRALLRQEDTHLTSTGYCEYRWLSTDRFAAVSLYIYGGKVAFLEFDGQKNVRVTLVENPSVTDSIRKMFETFWGQANVSPYGDAS